MVKKTRKPNLKQILWKMTKLVLKLVEEEEGEEEEEDEEICKHYCRFLIYMLQETHKPNLKEIAWKMAKFIFLLYIVYSILIN